MDFDKFKINCFNDLLFFLNFYSIKFSLGSYADCDNCCIIKNKFYILFLYYDTHLSYDLQKIPYTWGCSGSLTEIQLFNLLSNYMSINFKNNIQLSLF